MKDYNVIIRLSSTNYNLSELPLYGLYVHEYIVIINITFLELFTHLCFDSG